MESQLYQMFLLFTFTLTVLSFILNKNITLRAFSAAFLLGSANIVLTDPFFYIGFGSTGVITSVNSQAGDPGRGGEILSGWAYGMLGGVQVWYLFILIFRYATEQIKKRGKIDVDNIGRSPI